MSRGLVLALILGALLVVGGASLYIWSSGDDDSDESTETSQNETNEEGSPTFSPLATNAESFEAKMVGTTADGQNYTATIEFDGQDNSHYYGDFGTDQTFEVFSLNGRTIFCSENACFENPSEATSSPVTSDQYEYSDEDLTAYRDGANYVGEQSCPAGTCDVWEVTREGYTGKFFVDSNGRISKAEWTGAEGNFSLEYAYKTIVITEPENVQTFPTGEN